MFLLRPRYIVSLQKNQGTDPEGTLSETVFVRSAARAALPNRITPESHRKLSSTRIELRNIPKSKKRGLTLEPTDSCASRWLEQNAEDGKQFCEPFFFSKFFRFYYFISQSRSSIVDAAFQMYSPQGIKRGFQLDAKYLQFFLRPW